MLDALLASNGWSCQVACAPVSFPLVAPEVSGFGSAHANALCSHHIPITNTRSVSFVAFWLGGLLIRAASAHDTSANGRSSASSSSGSQEQMPIIHGHPLFIGGELGNRTLFQPGGVPMTRQEACEDERFASRMVRNEHGESSTLFRYCQDGLAADDAATDEPPSSFSEEETEDGALAAGRIVGGFRSHGSRYPYVALIFDEESPFCAGSLVAPTWVLTAAHCVDDSIVG